MSLSAWSHCWHSARSSPNSVNDIVAQSADWAVFYPFHRVSKWSPRSAVFPMETVIFKFEQARLHVRWRVARQSAAHSQDSNRADKMEVTKKLRALTKKTYSLALLLERGLRKLTEYVCVAQLSFPALINMDVLVLIPWPDGAWRTGAWPYAINHSGGGSASVRRNRHRWLHERIGRLRC